MPDAMDTDPGPVQARQFVRRQASYGARFEVHPDHADQFRLSFPDAQRGLTVTDVSEGGLGLTSGVFIPRNIRLVLHVAGLADAQNRSRKDAVIHVVARRCTMVDHKPNYSIGMQYIDPSGDDEQALVRDASRRESTGGPEKPEGTTRGG